MVRKHTWYQLAYIVWIVLVAGVGLFVATGRASAFLSPEDIPGGVPGGLGILIALGVAGLFVIGLLERREWTGTGRAAGLEPERRLNPFGKPAMTGTVRGRPVRVDTYTVSTGSGESSGSTTYTLVAAELRRPVDRGFFFGRGGDDTTPIQEDIPGLFQRHTVGDEFFVMGECSPDLGRDLPTPQVRDAFQGDASTGILVIGDPIDSIVDAVAESGGGLVGAFSGMMEDRLRERAVFDANAVSYSRKGLVLDAEQLEWRVDAVVAVADAYERAGEARSN